MRDAGCGPGADTHTRAKALPKTPPGADVPAVCKAYPQITDLAGIAARISAAGNALQGHRMIMGAPWLACHDPMRARLEWLRGPSADAPLSTARDQIAYALLIVAPA